MRLRNIFALGTIPLVPACTDEPTAAYPPSPVIAVVTFDLETLQRHAEGSDNWPVTWADDGHQYTSWGDGGGFGSSGNGGADRVSFGVARIEGPKDSYQVFNVWGGKDHQAPAWLEGKSYGLLSVDGVLYMWRAGDASNNSAFVLSELYKSTNHGINFTFTGVRYTPESFPGSHGMFNPTFLQFGQDYHDARDDFIYTYAPETQSLDSWEVQRPGKILLMRVPRAQIEDQTRHEFFSGLDSNGGASWTDNIVERVPVFSDSANGVMRTSVIYNAGLQRYLLTTQHVSRLESGDYHIGIYDAPEPWGPWTTVFFGNPKTDIDPPINTGHKTVFWNFSSKWMSENGQDFVLVYTGPGPDNWGTVQGRFTLADTVSAGAAVSSSPTGQ